MQRTIFRPDHRDYRESVKRLAAAKGMLAMGVGEEWGGSGVDDLRFNQTLVEEFAYAGVANWLKTYHELVY